MPRRASGPSLWPLIAVALWVPTAGVGAWRFLSPPEPAAPATPRVVAPPDDAREGIVVTLEEREVALGVMRENLDGLHGIVQAMAEGDRTRVAARARAAAELPGPARRSASLRAKLPDGWRALGKQVDSGFGELAEAAATPDADLAGPLSQATAACVACHARYRLDLQL